MKKVFACLIGITLCALFITCKKEYSQNDHVSLIDAAQKYFTENVANSGVVNAHNYRAKAAKTVQWDQARVIDISIGKVVVVPVTYQIPLFVKSNFGGNHNFNLNSLTGLLIYQDSLQAYHAELVSTFPDSVFLANPTGNFSGFKFVEDWQGNSIAKYLYDGTTHVRRYRPTKIAADMIITTCSTIDGYNYSPSLDDDPVEWSESGGCVDTYIADVGLAPTGGDYAGVGVGGGNGSGGGSGSTGFLVATPTNIIKDIYQYFDCFTNTPGDSYQVTVCVDQPYPGTRTPWAFSPYNAALGYANIIDCGHAFLIFTQTQSGGKVTRNVGLYPGAIVTPFTPSTHGVLNDDESHNYDISGTFTVNNSLFFSMLSYVSQGGDPGYLYNLNSNNCTTFALNTLAVGHIDLPSTIGGWFGGLGNDPGDFGEDLRDNNFVGMTRSTTEMPHPNVGTCN